MLAATVLALAACAPTSPPPVTNTAVSTSGGRIVTTGPSRASLEPTTIAALDNLLGSQVLRRLGQPDFTRFDPPAEIWQYRGTSCVLDVFLYPEGSDMRVAHVTSRVRQNAQAPADSCSPFAPIRTAAAN